MGLGKLKLLSKLKTSIRNMIPIGRISYSQEGEDLVLARILGELGVGKGFYVDVGAHHPARFSNTYFFYRRGWRGINVDALPGTERLFRRMRPRDLTIESGVGSQKGVLKYFMFNEPALNTFSEQEAKKKDMPPYHLLKTMQIPVVTLKSLLDQHLPEGMQIDFMSIDVEGFDHEVVVSNDWSQYRPHVVLVELLNTGMRDVELHPTAQVLLHHNYWPIAKTYNTFFFVAREAFPEGGCRAPEVAACGAGG